LRPLLSAWPPPLPCHTCLVCGGCSSSVPYPRQRSGHASSTSRNNLPAGGQAPVVNRAPPPKKGDKVLAAGETNVHGIHYRVVASTPDNKGPKRAVVPLYFNEYMGKPLKLLHRFEVPNATYYRDSVIANFK